MFAPNSLLRWLQPFFLIVGHEATAEPQNDPQTCTTITKAADRLACFDRAFAKPSTPPTAQVDLRTLVTKDRQCDLRPIHAALIKAVPPKSDYETKNAFAARGRPLITRSCIVPGPMLKRSWTLEAKITRSMLKHRDGDCGSRVCAKQASEAALTVCGTLSLFKRAYGHPEPFQAILEVISISLLVPRCVSRSGDWNKLESTTIDGVSVGLYALTGD